MLGTCSSNNDEFLTNMLTILKTMCSPGRFFAAHNMKLVLAEILQKYDIDYLPERPKGKHISDFLEPPAKAKITIRRRRDESSSSGVKS